MHTFRLILVAKYSSLVDGTAEKQIAEFIAQEHTFEEFTVLIGQFQNTVSQIQRELANVQFNMIYLTCDDLKIGLTKVTREHINKLLNVLITNHRTECKK